MCCTFPVPAGTLPDWRSNSRQAPTGTGGSAILSHQCLLDLYMGIDRICKSPGPVSLVCLCEVFKLS